MCYPMQIQFCWTVPLINRIKIKVFYLTAGQDSDGVASASARLQGVKNEFLCKTKTLISCVKFEYLQYYEQNKLCDFYSSDIHLETNSFLTSSVW
jgi:hypothetical protein